MKKGLIFLTLLLISELNFAEINTQYPGCTPPGSTATEVDTRPKEYYPVERPLNKEAVEANQTIQEQQ